MFGRKTLGLFVVGFATQTAYGIESASKLVLQKDFVKELMQKNMMTIFDRVGREGLSDIDIPNLKTKMTDAQISLQPKDGDFGAMDLEIFYEDNQILFELHDLEFSGDAQIHDPESGANEKVEFSGPLSLAKVEINISKESETQKLTIPNFEISKVSLVTEPSTLVVSTFGELPLYKAHAFEDEVKSILSSHTESISNDLKVHLQKAEDHLWKRFPWVYSLVGGAEIRTQLDPEVKVVQKHIEFPFKSELFGIPEDSFSKPLKKVNLKHTKRTNKDVQVLFDENMVNHAFAFLFEQNREYGLRDVLLSRLQDRAGLLGEQIPLLESMLTSKLAATIPGVENGKGIKNVDLRCSFNKQSLAGYFKQPHASEINFQNGNQIAYDLMFTCGIYFNRAPALKTKVWEPFKSFYVSADGDWEVGFKEMEDIQKIGITVQQSSFNLRKLVVIDDGKEVETNKKEWEKFIETLVSFDVMEIVPEQGKIPLQAVTAMGDIDLKTLPIIDMPQIPACLGMKPTNTMVQVKDGYVIMAYDFKISEANEVCIFDELEDLSEEGRKQQKRMDKRTSKFPSMAKQGLKSAKKFAKSKKVKNMASDAVKAASDSNMGAKVGSAVLDIAQEAATGGDPLGAVTDTVGGLMGGNIGLDDLQKTAMNVAMQAATGGDIKEAALNAGKDLASGKK